MAFYIKRYDGHRDKKYSERNEAIQFKTSYCVRMTGFDVYCDAKKNRKRSNTKVKLLRLPNDDEMDAEEIGSTEDSTENSGKGIYFKEPIEIRADIWHVLTGTISGLYSYGTGGKERVEEKGVVFEFRKSELSEGTDVTKGQFPTLYFELPTEEDKLILAEKKKQEQVITESKMFKEKIDEMKLMSKKNIDLTEKIVQLANALRESTEMVTGAEMRCKELIAENQQVKLNALQSAKGTLKFQEMEKMTKLLVCIQLENGTLMYFDNNKPFELFTMINGNRETADLKILEGEYDCSFKGTIGNGAYFSSAREKTMRFIKASIVNEQIVLDEINQVRWLQKIIKNLMFLLEHSDIDLFPNEPIYFIDELREWVVYHYHESFSKKEGEKFDTSEIRLIRKYKCHYHKGILYFFRANSAARLEKINDKVVIVEGPILEGRAELSFYSPPHSDCIYIANSDQNVLFILNTTNLSISQQSYEPPIESTYHSIVGVHEGILTMLFEAKAVGRCLMTTKLF